MNEIVVDTSIWVDFFRGTEMPELDIALRDGLVVLAPIVTAELVSAPLRPRERARLVDFLRDLPMHETSFEHWQAVGELRADLAKRGLTVSTPDAHIAQCAIDRHASVWSGDRVFAKISALGAVRTFVPS